MVLVNCNNDDNGEQSFVPQNITPILIVQSDLGGIFLPDINLYNNYFNNDTDWDLFVVNSMINPNIFNNIDFNTDTVIVCV